MLHALIQVTLNPHQDDISDLSGSENEDECNKVKVIEIWSL